MKNVKTTIRNTAIVLVSFASFLALLWFMGGNSAKADAQSLQESVQIAQADYDIAQVNAKQAMTQACTSWKTLALAKAELAEAVNLPHSFNKEAVKAVDCEAVTVPVSFL